MSGDTIPASTVLIVDDNPQNLELFEAYLERPGLTTLRATNGEEALEQVVTHRPDLILLDVMMPRMSGFEVCKKLKNDPETEDIRIIMVTALSEVSDQERAQDVGTDDFITQPVSRADLLARVDHWLRIRHGLASE